MVRKAVRNKGRFPSDEATEPPRLSRRLDSLRYHTQNYSDNPEQLVEEISRFGFKGKVVESRDRDIF